MLAISIEVLRATSRWMSNAHWCVRGVFRFGSITVFVPDENGATLVRNVEGDWAGGFSAGRFARRPPFCPKSVLIAANAPPGRLGRMVDAITKVLMRS